MENIKLWKIIFKGTIAEGTACPYCGKQGYDFENICKYCVRNVKPLQKS